MRRLCIWPQQKQEHTQASTQLNKKQDNTNQKNHHQYIIKSYLQAHKHIPSLPILSPPNTQQKVFYHHNPRNFQYKQPLPRTRNTTRNLHFNKRDYNDQITPLNRRPQASILHSNHQRLLQLLHHTNKDHRNFNQDTSNSVFKHNSKTTLRKTSTSQSHTNILLQARPKYNSHHKTKQETSTPLPTRTKSQNQAFYQESRSNIHTKPYTQVHRTREGPNGRRMPRFVTGCWAVSVTRGLFCSVNRITRVFSIGTSLVHR